jgi:flagellar basal body-associated protein FliL
MDRMTRHFRLGVFALAVLACALPPLTPGTAWAEEHAAPRPAYIALGEFTINLPARNEQLSYAVISITIEAVPEAATDLRAVEPRLKEAVMRRLMAMADRGVLQPGHTDLDAVKQALMSSLSELQPNSVRDVLIVRLLYG